MKLNKRLTVMLSLLMIFFAGYAYADSKKPSKARSERVITEKLYVYDPTVAERGWAFGFGVEAWYVSEGRDVVDAGGNKIGDSEKSGFLGGGTFYVGKGNGTFFIMGRKGNFTYDYQSNIDGVPISHETKVERGELEFKGRWLFPNLSFTFFKKLTFFPYAIGGVNYLTEDNSNLVKTPGYGFASTLSPQQNSKRLYISPLFGFGVLIPLTDTIGFRIDLVTNYSFAEKEWERTGQSWGEATGEDWGYAAHTTFYWAITDKFNIQIGLKEQKLDGGNDVGRTYFYGVYTMLGFAF